MQSFLWSLWRRTGRALRRSLTISESTGDVIAVDWGGSSGRRTVVARVMKDSYTRYARLPAELIERAGRGQVPQSASATEYGLWMMVPFQPALLPFSSIHRACMV